MKMEDIARGVLTGIALTGFSATIIEANLLALKALWRVNCLAVETVAEMLQGVERQQREREWERRRQQREAEKRILNPYVYPQCPTTSS